ncbi:Pre-mRNA leakage protein 1 [Rhodotorula toruloides]|nr:Pre-mRNA leakage protein 1 [Rhodotorula toruloides]
MGDRYAAAGPSSSRRRSPSPPSRSYDRDRDRDRRGGYDDRRYDNRDRDSWRGGGYDGRRDDRRGGYDDRRGGAGGGRRRSRSRSPIRSAERDAGAGGDGGWTRRQRDDSPRSSGKAKPLPDQRALVPGGGGEMEYGKRGGGGEVANKPVKQVEPDFKPSGALAAETNTLNGVVLKYAEPPEARKPVRNWRLYVFKGKEQVELFHVHRQSAYLIGRDRVVADIPVDHPSTSKQHAVLQFRQVVERNEFGDTKSLTKPFIIDLDSANGTMVNDETIPASRYYELRSGDVLKFAFSTREYVLLAEAAQT